MFEEVNFFWKIITFANFHTFIYTNGENIDISKMIISDLSIFNDKTGREIYCKIYHFYVYMPANLCCCTYKHFCCCMVKQL